MLSINRSQCQSLIVSSVSTILVLPNPRSFQCSRHSRLNRRYKGGPKSRIPLASTSPTEEHTAKRALYGSNRSLCQRRLRNYHTAFDHQLLIVASLDANSAARDGCYDLDPSLLSHRIDAQLFLLPLMGHVTMQVCSPNTRKDGICAT